jgi:hypothetical protein
MPLPKILPQIAWRAGLDRNPIDVNDPAEAAWLETLVWPETDRPASTIAFRDGDRCHGQTPAD